MQLSRYGFLFLFTSLSAGMSPAYAQPDLQKDAPVLLEANRMFYDQTHDIVVASGNVEVIQDDTILLADRISYHQTQNTVYAEGNVSLLEPTGNVYFAEEVTLRDDLKTGIVNQFRIRLADNSLFAAKQAEKVNEQRTKLRKAVYSPCKLCKKAPGKPPLWQIKSDKVTIDEAAQDITYRDAYFEVYGVPVAYTPYFSHPTPNADAKSGVLTPRYKQSSQLGTVVTVPYYVRMGDDKDATITPHITSEEGVVLEGQYRQLTEHGDYQFDGSITYPRDRDSQGRVTSGHELRGHIFAKGNSEINDRWHWGFDINRSSDDTYLRRYDFGSQDTLTSRLFAERIKDRNYFQVQGLAFQGLRENDDPDVIPLIIPRLTNHIESGPLWKGARARLDSDLAVLTRRTGATSRYLSMDGGVMIPHITPGGHVLEADASLRGDIYSVSNVTRSNGQEFDGSEVRVIPHVSLGWRYPMIKQVSSGSLTIEPMAKLVLRSNGNNPDTITNEDSLNPEFSDLNLFSRHRFAGQDAIENGSRLIYGVRGQWQMKPGQHVDAMIGQNYSLTGDPIFPLTNEPDPNLSDYVGRFSMRYDPVDISYRFRLDSDDLGLRRSEVRAHYHDKTFSAGLDYIYIDEDPSLENQREIIGSAAVRLNQNWSWLVSGQRDLRNSRSIAAATGLTYQNDCITVHTTARREFTRDRDIEPDTSFGVEVLFKNLN